MGYSDNEIMILFSNIDIILQNILNSAEQYTNRFKKDDLFELTVTEQKSKKYKNYYFAFTEKLIPLVDELDNLIAELIVMLEEAELSMNDKSTNTLLTAFESYKTFEVALYRYTSDTETALLQKNATAAFLNNCTSRLKMAVGIFRNVICSNHIN